MTTKAKRVKKPKAARVAKAAKPKAEKKVRAKKAKGEKKARRARKTNGEAAGRITMVYQLTDGIPATLRDPSATRTILEAIKERGKATKKELAEDLGPKFPDPTLRFNLWKMHTAGVLTVVSA